MPQVTGYQLRTCGWVGSAKFQFASFAGGSEAEAHDGKEEDSDGSEQCSTDDDEHGEVSSDDEEEREASEISDTDVLQVNVSRELFHTTRQTFTQVCK